MLLDPAAAGFRVRLAAAFTGDPDVLPAFWLYTWHDGEFVLVREPTIH
jgi:hypothetical protein